MNLDLLPITQQEAENYLCEFARDFDAGDERSLDYRLDVLSRRMAAGHRQPNILSWLIEYGERVWDQLEWWNKNPQIPRPTPVACEPYIPWRNQQLTTPAELVKKELRIEKQRQKLLANGV